MTFAYRFSGEVMGAVKKRLPQMFVQTQTPDNVKCLEIRGLAVGADDSISTGFLYNLTMPKYCGHWLH